jgi:hypothetical protein
MVAAAVTAAVVATAVVATAVIAAPVPAAPRIAVPIASAAIIAVPFIAAPIAAAPRAHPITITPAAVIIAIRLIVAAVVITHSHAFVDPHAGHCAGNQRAERKSPESGRQPTMAQDVHFGSAVLSFWVHSISPNGAPAGSATTATCPP